MKRSLPAVMLDFMWVGGLIRFYFLKAILVNFDLVEK